MYPKTMEGTYMALTTLNVRGIEAGAALRIKRGAAARGILIGKYLALLVDLHDDLRSRAAKGDAHAASLLKAHSLTAVSA
jgi:hypothetical protein